MKLIPVNNSLYPNLLDHFFEFGRVDSGNTRSLFEPSFQVPSNTCDEPHSGLRTREDEDHFYVRLDVPGFKKKDLDIKTEDNKLRIRGSRKENFDDTKEHVLHINRNIILGDQVREDGINAKLENGVLEVILPKVEKPKARVVSIG